MVLASLKVALRSLRAHRMRSALTTLGIIIGVAALVMMVAVGSGARDRIAAQIRSLGANLISINPGSAVMSSVRLEAVLRHGCAKMTPWRSSWRYPVPSWLRRYC